MKIFFYGLKNTFKNLLQIKYFLLIVAGFILTYLLVTLGFDWWYFTYFYNTPLHSYIWPAIVIGMFMPTFLPFILLGYGKFTKKQNLVKWAGLLGQSAFLGWLFSSTIKAFTGRIEPNFNDLMLDISGSFNFGFWEHGIFWGFPSSHTTVAFSVAFACVAALSKHEKSRNVKLSQFFILLYALYVGMSVSISIHWFTDFLVGSILGYIIGTEVGKSFKKII